MKKQALVIAMVMLVFSGCGSDQATRGTDSISAGENPYDVERSFPDYFLEGRKFSTEEQGTHQAGTLPVYTVNAPNGWLGNSTFIVGDDGVIVYDTSLNTDAGEHIAQEIRKVTDKPIKAIFYSHHHTDHYNGTSALVTQEQLEAGDVRIYSWDNFEEELANEFGEILPRQTMGVMYYGPDLLAEEDKHYHGIPGLKILGGVAGYIPPTDRLSQDTKLDIAGVSLNVFYTGGEAISEFGIHIPEFDMVIIADEVFYGIPNVHSIRGSKPRLPQNYITAHDRVLEIEPEWLLGSHIIPIQGKENIRSQVTKYRDATQWMWDQSIRLINKGYTATEIQRELADLPDYLYSPPLTVPLYGTPLTTTPEIFGGWVSWFSGDSTDLFPSDQTLKASRYVDMMGGRDKVIAAAKESLREGDPQFAAELAQMLVRIDHDDQDARLVKAAALRARGYKQVNPIMRAWYLHGAMELEGSLDPKAFYATAMKTFERILPPIEVVSSWRYLLDSEAAGEGRSVIGFRTSDTGGEVAAEIRNGVLIAHESIPEDVDAVVALTLAELNAASRPGGSFNGLDVDGDTAAVQRLDRLLDREVGGFYMHIR